MATVTEVLVADTFVRSQTPTTNLGTSVEFAIQGDTGQTYRAFLRATLPSGSGTITKVTLNVYLFNKGTNSQSGNVQIHSLTRTDWVENQATYNIYKTGNNWTTAGGDFDSTIIHKISNPTTTGWKQWDLMGGSADNPLTLDWNDTVDLLMKYQTENTSSSPDDYCVFWAREYAVDTALRPYIEITYTSGGNSNFFAMM